MMFYFFIPLNIFILSDCPDREGGDGSLNEFGLPSPPPFVVEKYLNPEEEKLRFSN
jgi:hypothetical protein